jgi:CHAT domain-containing protein
MARGLWCLCLILTLSIAGSRRPAVARTIDADPWWGTEEAREIRKEAEQFRAAKNFAAAEAVDLRGYNLAVSRRDDAASFVYLTAIGGAQLYQYQYRSALDAFLLARDLAERLKDPVAQGIVAFNLSSLYLQTWDLESAVAAAEAGIARLGTDPKSSYRLPLLLHVGRIHKMLGDGTAAAFFAQAVEESRRQGDVPQEARAWDLLGEERLRERELEQAEANFGEALRLRLLWDHADLAFSQARLGAVKLALGEWESAARFTDRALALDERGPKGLPRYLLLHQRGEIRRAQGDLAGALTDFTTSLDQSGLWRNQLMPTRQTLIAANAELEKRIFQSFIESAASAGLRHDSRLAGESFQAAESNRAVSLRESQSVSQAWRAKISPEYWKTLAELREVESQNERSGTRRGELRLALAEMEAKAGIGFATNNYENFRGQSSLIHFQQGLGASELFLSFYLGDAESYLWVVSRNSLSIHRLPAAGQIRSTVEKFREAVRRGVTSGATVSLGASPEIQNGSETEQLGRQIYASWFGELSREESAKSDWVLSLDGATFRMPFAALPSGAPKGEARGVRSERMKYLVEQHSLRAVPGALWLMENLISASRGQPESAGDDRLAGRFLGVGDPIYNTADSRWIAEQSRHGTSGSWFAFGGTPRPNGQWNRLAGSATEVEASARSWTGVSGATLLTGRDARRDRFLKAAAQHPAIIHLATHVYTPGNAAGAADAMIAFGLDESGRSEGLSTSEVGMLDVAGAVVAMSGCDSGLGDIKPGAGLIGLTRGWQMAGARAVIATSWPVGDTQGDLFAALYRHLETASPSEALRRSQVEMIHSGTWRSSPAYWASYWLTGGGHHQ